MVKSNDSPPVLAVADVKGEQNGIGEDSSDASSTSSITWDNTSVLSEVDIADLYEDLH